MRQVGILAALLAAALVGSYLAWTADEADTTKAEQVLVYRAGEDDVQSLTWKDDKTTVLVERRTDAKGAYVWVTASETVAVDAPEPDEADTGEPVGPDDAPAPDAPTPDAQTETRVVSFKGNDAADQLWKDFAPLYALRELHPESGVSDAAFGFDTPSGTLEVARRSGPLTLVLGGETYGAKDRYARVDGRVFLLDDKTLRPLQYARTRLVDRLLEPLGEAKVDRVEVTSGTASATFVRQNKDDPSKAFWAREGTPTQEDAAGAAWIGKLLRLRVQDYDVPADTAGLMPVFRYTVHGGSDSWSVEILQDASNDRQYYARGDYSRGVVHLTESLAAEAIADLPSVVP